MSSNNKRLDDYFPKSLVGLDLLQNPSKCRRSGFSFQDTGPSPIPKTTSKSPFDKYSDSIRERLTNFQVPLRSYDRSDPLMVLLEAGYYHYRATHPSDMMDDGGVETSKTDNVMKDADQDSTSEAECTSETDGVYKIDVASKMDVAGANESTALVLTNKSGDGEGGAEVVG